jgi:histidine triad (HIT) family protein
MQDCIFCKIVEGEIPSNKVFETDDLFAFEDINPVAPVHVIVIPKRHIETLNDTSDTDKELLGQLLLSAQTIAKEKNVSGEGYRTVINCLAGAGQTVFHLHMHVIGGRGLRWPPG